MLEIWESLITGNQYIVAKTSDNRTLALLDEPDIYYPLFEIGNPDQFIPVSQEENTNARQKKG